MGTRQQRNEHRHLPNRRRVADAVASLLRDTDEELEASRTYDELSKLGVEEWSSFLAARPHRRTESLVARLAAEGRRETEKRPELALAILAVAESVANELRDVFLLAEWRARLARERASALLALRRYPEALDAVDSAEAFLAHVRDANFDLPFVRWLRARIFFETERHEEALNLAVAVVRAFDKCDDLEYANQARILVADICYVQGNVGDALSMYRDLLVYFEEQKDEEIASTLTLKISSCQKATRR
jgi:tetratricopeptide (TPR) repeat protein